MKDNPAADYKFDGQHFEKRAKVEAGKTTHIYTVNNVEVSQREWTKKLDDAIAHEVATVLRDSTDRK